MQVLIITGDKSFKPGHPRFDLQAGAVERLEAVYWGPRALMPRLPEGPFDVVSVQDPFWRGLFGWFVARRLRAKFNVQVHTDLRYLVRGYRLRAALRAARPSPTALIRYPLARFVLRRADSVRAVSQSIKEQVERMGVRAPVRVLPVFVDIEKFKAVEPRPHAQKTILWLGRFEAEKCPLQALEVLAQVRQSVDARLVMLGSGGLERALKERVKGLPVELPGWQDPRPYLAQADVVLSTSREEGWGASIVEALAAGVPVVAPEVGVAREAGAVVVPRTELARAVVQVLQEGGRATLRLPVLSREAWARAWKETLL
jgi:glycosyltransferase involved in cell wall biosynthesis